MAKFDLVIPHYGVNDDINFVALKCLQSIRFHSKEYRLILINNSGISSEMLNELDRHKNVVLINNKENLGFVKAVNQGLFISNAEYIVVMNNDTEAVPQWLEKLIVPFSFPSVGLVGPKSTAQDSWQGRFPVYANQGWMCLAENAMLAFFCVMIRAKVVRTIGYLDEDFGIGLGDDDDYCARANKAGFRLAVTLDLTIPHYHRTTFKALYRQDEIVKMQTKALEKFRSKNG
jgi:GT2 family glycosyltransferase